MISLQNASSPFHSNRAIVRSCLAVLVLLVVFCLCQGCTDTSKEPVAPSGPAAKDGDPVTVYYQVSLPDGEVFESNFNNTPIGFTIGDGTMIPGFNEAVRGMHPGETKEVNLTADQAYGPHRDDLVETVPRSNFPENFTPLVGGIVEYVDSTGRAGVLTVKSFNETTITVDKNHPLAGMPLHFKIYLIQIGNVTATP